MPNTVTGAILFLCSKTPAHALKSSPFLLSIKASSIQTSGFPTFVQIDIILPKPRSLSLESKSLSTISPMVIAVASLRISLGPVYSDKAIGVVVNISPEIPNILL